MINLLIFIFFLIYNTSLFLIKDLSILIYPTIFNTTIHFILYSKSLKHVKLLQKNLPFLTIIFLSNLPFYSITIALTITIRLYLIIDFTCLISTYLSTSKLKDALTTLLKPLKLFNIDVQTPILIITIALAILPILIDEAKEINYSLKSKGFQPSFQNILTKPHIYILTFLNNLFNRLDALEKTLTIKYY